MKKELGQTNGPAISNVEGLLWNQSKMLLVEVLDEMFDRNPSAFPAEINKKEKIGQFYHCFRTFRRTLDTRAIDARVSEDDIDVVN